MIGRNELCPCGSGRKYKKCCLEKDRAKDIARNRIKLGENQFNNVILKVSESISEDYKSYKNKFEIDFGVSNYELENLMNVYYLVNYKYNKQSSLMMNYFNKHKHSINNTDMEVIEDTLNSYMSVYQIKEKDINKILLRDMILSEDVYVEDIDLFSEFKESDFLLARIIPVANTKIFVDKVVKISEGRKTKIKNDIDNRFKQTKKKCKTKKQCLINNIKFIYQNLIEVRREYILDTSCEVEEENIEEVLKTTKTLNEEIEKEIMLTTVQPIDKQTYKQIEQQMVKYTDGQIQQSIDKQTDEQIQEQMVKQSKESIVLKIEKPIKNKNKKEKVKQKEDKEAIKEAKDKKKIKDNKNIEVKEENNIEKQVDQVKDIEGVRIAKEENNIEKQEIKKESLKEPIQKTKQRKQLIARLSKNPEKFRNRKRRNKKLEVKLKQRIIKTKKIQGIMAGIEFIRQTKLIKEKELSISKDSYVETEDNNIKTKDNIQIKNEVPLNKIENIQPYKAEPIESKIENISMSKTEQQIESKIENNIVAKMMVEDLPKEQCKIYNTLISKVENEYKEQCIDAWQDFKKVHESYTGKENGWAAAIEYYVKKNIDDTVTQEQISKKYNISARTLGKRYKQLKIS